MKNSPSFSFQAYKALNNPDNLKPTFNLKTEDRLSQYSGQLSQVMSQDCRKYITQNFDLEKLDLFGKKGMARFIQLLWETQEAKREPRIHHGLNTA